MHGWLKYVRKVLSLRVERIKDLYEKTPQHHLSKTFHYGTQGHFFPEAFRYGRDIYTRPQTR